jgi:hypothetical protein
MSVAKCETGWGGVRWSTADELITTPPRLLRTMLRIA